jgi:hypothetical protein
MSMYVTGFENSTANSSFWLGLENIHALAYPGSGAALRVELTRYNFPMAYGTYSQVCWWWWRSLMAAQFSVNPAQDGYRLNASGFVDGPVPVGDSMGYHSGSQFCAYDTCICAQYGGCASFAGQNPLAAAWWWKDCNSYYCAPSGYYVGYATSGSCTHRCRCRTDGDTDSAAWFTYPSSVTCGAVRKMLRLSMCHQRPCK